MRAQMRGYSQHTRESKVLVRIKIPTLTFFVHPICSIGLCTHDSPGRLPPM